MPITDKITPALVIQDARPPLSRRFSKAPVGPWEKIVYLFKKILIVSLVWIGAILGNLLTLGIPTLVSLISRVQRKDLKASIKERQLQHLQPVLEYEFYSQGLEGSSKAFVEEVLQFQQEARQMRSPRAIYKKLQKLIKHNTSVLHRLQEHPSIYFLKLLAAKFRSADVSDLLIEHAKEELGTIAPDQEEGYSIAKTGEALVAYRNKPSFKHNFFWAISHPSGWQHSWEAEWLHKKYDSHASNPTYTIFETDYTAKNGPKTARFIAGPTPFNDPVYYNLFLKGGHEVRYNIMDTSKRQERSWIGQMHQAAQDSSVEHVVWGFATKEKRGYLEQTELAPLINRYEEGLLESRSLDSPTGVVVPDHLSEEEIRAACALTKELFANADLSEKAARHAVLVAIDTMLSLGILIRYLEQVETAEKDPDLKAVYVAAACKQCFDRGPVYLSALLLFFRSLHSDAPLTQEEFYRIVGVPLFRAPLNEGREQMKDKFVVYEHLAKNLNMKTLSEKTREYREKI